MEKNKVLYLTQQFQKDMPLPTADAKIDSINIEGYANTTCVDRSGDVIPMTAWNKALDNYLKNPIILAYHDADEPIGRMIDHRVDEKGLWVKARISAAAEDVFNLVKDGVLTAFSVGFTIKDAVYDAVTDLFIIKELELMEISVVSIPCNQDSMFSLSKAFDNAEDYSKFKSQYQAKKEEVKELSPPAPSVDTNKKEWNMDPKELEVLLAKAAADAATKTAEAIAQKAAETKAAEMAQAKADAELNARINAAIEVKQSGAEKLLADIEKRVNEQTETSKSALAGLEAAIAEKSAELKAIQASKMNFSDKNVDAAKSFKEREDAYLLSKFMGKGLSDTRYGMEMVQKYGQHVPSANWELEISTSLEAEIRRQLVVAPLFRSINMKTNVMTVPVNPEAGYATWMANTSFGTTASTGASQQHVLKEITLNAYKVATLDYLNFEEDEDAVLALLPIIKEGMVRRVARAVDKAFLLGTAATADPVRGLANYDATSVGAIAGSGSTTPTATGAATVANLRALRRDLGAYSLVPSDVFFIVSTDIYYDLLEDTSFMTWDKVGPNATILQGSVGQVGGTTVLVSDAFPVKGSTSATSTAVGIGAVCVNPSNFIVGNQRGVRLDTQDMVETQRKALVASMRTGLVAISTTAAANAYGVSALRWS